MTDLDEIKWGRKTPLGPGTVLDQSRAVKLWRDDGSILICPAGRTWTRSSGPTHYAYPEAPPMTEAVGWWGANAQTEIFAGPGGSTHRLTVTYPGDVMPEFDLPIPGGGSVKMERVR